MSGWQRIGVVITTLWLLGFPIWVVVDQQNRAQSQMEFCVQTAVDSYSGAEENRRVDECGRRFTQDVQQASLLQLLKTYQFQTPNVGDSVAIWALTLIPIVLLWGIGGIVIGTLRWIRRGFSGNAIEQGGIHQ